MMRRTERDSETEPLHMVISLRRPGQLAGGCVRQDLPYTRRNESAAAISVGASCSSVQRVARMCIALHMHETRQR